MIFVEQCGSGCPAAGSDRRVQAWFGNARIGSHMSADTVSTAVAGAVERQLQRLAGPSGRLLIRTELARESGTVATEGQAHSIAGGGDKRRLQRDRGDGKCAQVGDDLEATDRPKREETTGRKSFNGIRPKAVKERMRGPRSVRLRQRLSLTEARIAVSGNDFAGVQKRVRGRNSARRRFCSQQTGASSHFPSSAKNAYAEVAVSPIESAPRSCRAGTGLLPGCAPWSIAPPAPMGPAT